MYNITDIEEECFRCFMYFGDAMTTETEKFTLTFDRFFNCLNVRSLSEWKVKRKPDLKPYTNVDDPRLEVPVF